ncbi:MAG: hypothetical protein GWN81_20315, partial [Phycisphaerae bacterium]|nr:hypothetical protein [Phycisphaerae bacterium]NIP51683.1 hypothetical protein [Phycisphaerae bacterium]NIU11133.1 hypothetical protein [Phycisphaerae bacterium]NIX01240.1 hypothetical protein [Phycisphaerae bacterium]NIX27701.1 hypothetical protein [Phycisphaerae bacterium]
MNAIRFGVYAGLIWALVSVVLIEISVINGSETAWVELDFRFLSGLGLITMYGLDLSAGVSEIIKIAQYGMPINALNSIAAIASGFIDGFVSGFFIAIYYNLISIVFESKDLPAPLKFGVATGKVFGICSGLLGLVSMYYNFLIEAFSFSIRPVFLAIMAIPESSLTTLRESYLLFPHTYWGVIQWVLWGFV